MIPIEPVNVDKLTPGDIVCDPHDERLFVVVVSVSPQYKSVHLTYAHTAESREHHHIDLPYTAFFMTFRAE